MSPATINPSTGLTEMLIEPHSAAEVEEFLQLAEETTVLLSQTTFAQRSSWMIRAADILEDQAEGLGELISVEMGKPIAQAVAEVHKSVSVMRYYAEHAEHFLADIHLKHSERVSAPQTWIRHEPLGIVLAITPWNYPLLQVVQFAAPALMAGNIGLLKHASTVPQSALLFNSLFTRAGFPKGAFQTLLITESEGTDLIQDGRVKAVAFTGPAAAGRSVASIACRQVKKAILELGGSGPFIVLPSANLDASVEAAVHASTTNSGQSSAAGRRIIAHTDVYDAFSAAFVQKMSALTVGDPLDPKTDIGPLATLDSRNELVELVDDAVARGANLLTGGIALETPGYFYPPTVLSNLSDDMLLAREGAFGPVASLYRATDNDEVLRTANQIPFGRSCAVWTNDPAEQDWFVSRLQSGAVFINGLTISDQEPAHGSVEHSGYGRGLPDLDIREFCSLKTVWKAWSP